ncbi:MBOAT family protein [Candidatus Pseudothioglobus singularis]|nr:MBOAT family protein [Candidatus Pseudothioglobus singularis]
MIFNSLTYLALLLIIVPLYWILPYRARLLLIFSASLIFYGFWRVEFIPIMLTSVVLDYVVALKIPTSTQLIKKRLILVSLVINLGLLFYFKYLIFFAENAIGLFNLIGADIDPLMLNIILPLGISFYTFQTISYTVDVYRGRIKPEKDFILYGCYVTFFPQLVAGPILRASEVIHQFVKRPPFLWSDIAIGIRRIIYGLFLKVVLADNIAPLVDTGYSIPLEAMSAIDVWTLAFLFGFQIYFDFSAYSHIALGSARLIGIKFPENFNFPYLASSPKHFWSRWHISLSSWIRDYLYLPLAGIHGHNRSIGGLANATHDIKKNKALFVTWAIMGLWHGSNWTFILWGFYHSVVIFVYRLIAKYSINMNYNLKVIIGVFLTLPIMMLSWIPFRAESLTNAIGMWLKVINISAYSSIGMRENTYLITFIILICIFIIYWVKKKLIPLLTKKNITMLLLSEILAFSIMTSLIIVFLRPINQFIYFQF